MISRVKGIAPTRTTLGYMLPNLLTTGNLFFGYYSIIKSMQGDFTWAAGAIFLSSIFDVLDGRVARLTRTMSEFGVQYDSLCDLVSFGVAPALLMYQYSLRDFGRMGWIFCFIFTACGALRLARFNVLSAKGKTSEDFIGLPIPMAAGTVASFVAFTCDKGSRLEGQTWLISFIYEFLSDKTVISYVFLVLAPCLAFLMISNIRYRSFKNTDIKGVKPFRVLALLVVLIALTAYKPDLVSMVLFFSFALSGILEWTLGWESLVDDDEVFESESFEEGNHQ
ncbi:MAG: CDP-diacylglycerol--serine O-phosphatidyltransferase [Oligoflexales bacterium]|nr:CDP-diacylglycerol--serine O-phosphatidyltransferase [Oligoflexales bacterium]